jgi:hypothetical protein
MDHSTVNNYRLLATLLCAAALAACDKNAVQVLPTGPLLGSRIKFFHFAASAPSVNFYADSIKMTGVVPPATGLAYGGAANGGAYSTIAAGPYTLTGRISSGADLNRPIATIDTTLATGKFYSFYMIGLYDAVGKIADALVLEDDYPAQPDYRMAQVRFVHTIGNAAPLTLYAANTVTNDTLTVTGPVAYKSASGFMAVPEGVYNLFARYTDSTDNKITRESVSFVGGHAYTVGARGNITVTSTTATNRPFLDNTANR